MMNRAKRAAACALVTLLVASVAILVAGDQASAQAETRQVTCEVGELVGGVCVETGNPPTRDAGECPTRADVFEDETGCYELRAPLPQPCPDGSTASPDGNSCRVPVEPLVEQQGGECPVGFAVGVAPLVGRCTQRTTPLEAAPQCYPNRGQADSCYFTEPVARVCPQGELAGEFCVVVGSPPIVTDGLAVCEFEFALVGERCVRYVVPSDDGQCQQGALDDFGLCRVSIDDRASEPQCIDPAETLEGDNCVVRLPEGDSVCPASFVLTQGDCSLSSAAQQIPTACPDGTRGEADGCYIFVMIGPAPAPFCDRGELRGNVCVVSFGPPPCDSFAAEIDDDCVAYFTPTSPFPNCPVDSALTASFNCLRPVANAATSLACDAPAAALQGDGCVITTPALNCSAEAAPEGFTFDNGECVRSTPATMSSLACLSAITFDGECFDIIASAGSETLTCAEGTVDVVELRCVVPVTEIVQEPTLSCPPGFSEDAALGGICARFEAAVTGAACPDGARGEPGGCYILVAFLPQADPVCFEGELEGSNCVIVGDPPAVGIDGELLCDDGFGLVEGRCLRFESPSRPAPQCPDGALEDSEGQCRQPVDDEIGLSCPDPNSALNGSSCVFTAGFIITANPPLLSCDAGELAVAADGNAICVVGDPVSQSIEDCPIDNLVGSVCLAPTTPEAVQYCEDPAANLLDNECVVVADARCPAGFTLDDSLGAVCARFEPAQVTQGTDFCPVDGSLLGRSCVFTTDYSEHCVPGTSICGDSTVVISCPDGATLADNSCFQTIPMPDLVCPHGTTRVSDTECRSEVDLVPGPLSCEDGFDLVGNRCRRLSDPTITYSFVRHGQPTWIADADSHALATNEAGDSVVVAVKANGDLWARRVSSASTDAWQRQGIGDWSNADVAIDESGRAEIIAVKADGRLFTRSWLPSGAFGPWTRHGLPTWDVDAQPAIATNGSTIVYGAVKADGRLFTRTRSTTSKWNAYVEQGATDWANVGVAVSAEDDLWLAAVRDDGRLFTRQNAGGSWRGFELHGSPTWAPDAAPSISTGGGDVIYAAVKDDGRLFSRAHPASSDWQRFVQHGRDSWTGGEIVMNANGDSALIGVKEFGALYTRLHQGAWGSWTEHGLRNWSAGARPAVSLSETNARLLAVKTAGNLYTRTFE